LKLFCYYDKLLKNKNLCIYIRIGMTSKLKEINFNDLPREIKLKIYNINKEDQKKNEYRIYPHLKGKFMMYRKRNKFINFRGEEVVENTWSYKLQKQVPYRLMWYWTNCVGCGKDTSKKQSAFHHACYNCWSKDKYKRTAPIATYDDNTPMIKNNKPVIADAAGTFSERDIVECLID